MLYISVFYEFFIVNMNVCCSQKNNMQKYINNNKRLNSYLQPFSQCADENFIVWQEDSTNIENLLVS